LLRSSSDSITKARLIRSPILPTILFSWRVLSQIISAIVALIRSLLAAFPGFFPRTEVALLDYGLASQTWLITSTDFFLTLVLVSAVLRMIAFKRTYIDSRTTSNQRALLKKTAAAYTASR